MRTPSAASFRGELGHQGGAPGVAVGVAEAHGKVDHQRFAVALAQLVHGGYVGQGLG